MLPKMEKSWVPLGNISKNEAAPPPPPPPRLSPSHADSLLKHYLDHIINLCGVGKGRTRPVLLGLSHILRRNNAGAYIYFRLQFRNQYQIKEHLHNFENSNRFPNGYEFITFGNFDEDCINFFTPTSQLKFSRM